MFGNTGLNFLNGEEKYLFGELYDQIFMTHYVTLKFVRSGATMTWPIPAVAIEACASRDSKEIEDFLYTSSLMRNNDFS